MVGHYLSIEEIGNRIEIDGPLQAQEIGDIDNKAYPRGKREEVAIDKVWGKGCPSVSPSHIHLIGVSLRPYRGLEASLPHEPPEALRANSMACLLFQHHPHLPVPNAVVMPFLDGAYGFSEQHILNLLMWTASKVFVISAP
jgi:hypothetical protein